MVNKQIKNKQTIFSNQNIYHDRIFYCPICNAVLLQWGYTVLLEWAISLICLLTAEVVKLTQCSNLYSQMQICFIKSSSIRWLGNVPSGQDTMYTYWMFSLLIVQHLGFVPVRVPVHWQSLVRKLLILGPGLSSLTSLMLTTIQLPFITGYQSSLLHKEHWLTYSLAVDPLHLGASSHLSVHSSVLLQMSERWCTLEFVQVCTCGLLCHKITSPATPALWAHLKSLLTVQIQSGGHGFQRDTKGKEY